MSLSGGAGLETTLVATSSLASQAKTSRTRPQGRVNELPIIPSPRYFSGFPSRSGARATFSREFWAPEGEGEGG